MNYRFTGEELFELYHEIKVFPGDEDSFDAWALVLNREIEKRERRCMTTEMQVANETIRFILWNPEPGKKSSNPPE